MATYIAKHAIHHGRNYCRFAKLLLTEQGGRLPWSIGVRHHAQWFRPMLFKLRNQIKSIDTKYGPESPKPRSHKENWNYQSELFAFGKRIGEDFNEATIRTAFTDISHIERMDTGGVKDKAEEVRLPAEDNQLLAQIGDVFMSDYIREYFRVVYPRLPEEGINGIHDYLMSEDVMLHIAKNLGLVDLILCAEFPIPDAVLHRSFLAVIGAIVKDQDLGQAGQFVCDFIIAHLISQDIGALCHYEDPMGLLSDILKKEDRGPPEARLLRETGRNTVVALYMVGIYSDQKLLGWAPGNTLPEAEEEATRVALKNYFGTTENTPPLPLDPRTRCVNADVVRTLQSKMKSVASL
ncbi:large ribosomal subunit protein mL44-like [Amphiura filiformis]|uniref:large ribosomal subunit protein mL44-like n=1 Tax=Amphiura filiformis TaxID=82378 RepID=UPI003B21194A